MREPRQKNVQQQNAITLQGLRNEAHYWRTHPWPAALAQVAEARGVHEQEAILIDFGIGPDLYGTLVTPAGRFISFEIDGDSPQPLIHEWLDITERQNFNLHNKGIGIGAGALALQVLRELNAALVPRAVP